MRLPREWIGLIAKGITENLTQKEMVRFKVPMEEVVEAIEEMIIEELMVEDRLDEEVKEMLKQYEVEIEREKLDYKRLFDLTKQKLVRERNLIL